MISSDVIQSGVLVVSGFVFSVVGLFVFRRYMFRIQQQITAADMLSNIVSSFNKSIELREQRVLDLIMRVELLELRAKADRISPVSAINKAGKVGFGVSDINYDINSDINLTETETRVMQCLDKGPRKISDVREDVGKSREHTSRIVSNLVKRGLLVKYTKGGQVYCQVPD